jgi:hypothetical protein
MKNPMSQKTTWGFGFAVNVRDDAITLLAKEEHLRVPGVGGERPAM